MYRLIDDEDSYVIFPLTTHGSYIHLNILFNGFYMKTLGMRCSIIYGGIKCTQLSSGIGFKGGNQLGHILVSWIIWLHVKYLGGIIIECV